MAEPHCVSVKMTEVIKSEVTNYTIRRRTVQLVLPLCNILQSILSWHFVEAAFVAVPAT